MTDWDRKINKAHEKKPVIIENRCSSIQKNLIKIANSISLEFSCTASVNKTDRKMSVENRCSKFVLIQRRIKSSSDRP